MGVIWLIYKIMDKLEFQKRLGDQVRCQRKMRGFSQEQLAEAADLHHTFISNVERGRVSASAYSLFKIATALKIKLAELLHTEDGSGDDLDLNTELATISGTIRNMASEQRDLYISAIKGMLPK